MGKKLTLTQTKKKLQSIVNLKGHEYVYEHPIYEDEYGEYRQSMDCHYTDRSGKPSCLVGALLAEVAPGMLKTLHSYEWQEQYEPQVVASATLEGENHTGVNLSEVFELDALKLVHRVQRRQDDGYSWGEALDLATKS
jgi:hypothetical protein